jgi:hypothetical protein
MPIVSNLPYLPRPPMEPGEKMRPGPTDWSDPDGGRAAAQWLAHVEAGRIGMANTLSHEARETILANERLMFGRQRTIIR